MTPASPGQLRERHAELLTIAVEQGFEAALPGVEPFRRLCQAITAGGQPGVDHGLRMLAKRLDQHWHAESYVWLERKPDLAPLPAAAPTRGLGETPALGPGPDDSGSRAAATPGPAPRLEDVRAGAIKAARWSSEQFAGWLREQLRVVDSPRRLRRAIDRLLADGGEALCCDVLVPGVILVIEGLRADKSASAEMREHASALGGAVASRSFLHLRPTGWRDLVPVFDVRWGEVEDDAESARVSPWVNDRDLDRVVSRGLGYLQVAVAEDLGVGATLAFLHRRVSALAPASGEP